MSSEDAKREPGESRVRSFPTPRDALYTRMPVDLHIEWRVSETMFSSTSKTGSRVNVLATARVGDKLQAFPLIVNVLVVAVDVQAIAKESTLPTVQTVSFAVKEKEALLLALAKQRGCHISLVLRNPDKLAEADKSHDIDAVTKLLRDAPEVAVEVAPAPRPVGGGK